MQQLTPVEQKLLDKLLAIDKEINGMMDTALAGGKVDQQRLAKLQDELQKLLAQLDDKPDVKTAYNLKIGKI